MINKYDIGLYLLTPSNFTETTARLISFLTSFSGSFVKSGAISPLSEMKKDSSEKQKLGWCVRLIIPKLWQDEIPKLNIDDIQQCKENSHQCALSGLYGIL